METQKPSKFPPYRRRRPLPSHSFSTFIRIISQCQHSQLHSPEQFGTVEDAELVENSDSTIPGDQRVANNDIRPDDGLSHEKSVVNENTQDPGFRGEHMETDALGPRDKSQANQNASSDFASKNDCNGQLLYTAVLADTLNLVENRSRLVYYGDIVEDERTQGQDCKPESGRNRQGCGFEEANSQSLCPKILTLSGGSTGENTVENQGSASTKKVNNLKNNKRKQVPGSDDRKARKKRKKRMKHAEEDIKLGVNKLKLPPVTMSKTIKYCHRFVKGRCQEGEKCRFSHDTVPLTKSKACSHFARQSCMKGDDCSYDHQLSKYPCNNYLSTGSCSRGSNCMFSHDLVPVKESSSEFELSISVRETSNLKKPACKQKVNAKSCSSEISLSKNENNNGHTEQAPRGISLFSHGKLPWGSMSMNGKGASSPKADNGAEADQQKINGLSDLVLSLDKNTQRTPAMPTRKVNFLSFGKAPLESSSNKKSSFSSLGNLETGKSLLSNPNKRQHVGSSLDTDDGIKVGSQTGGGASSISQNLNELANRTPAMTPQGLSSISVGNHLDPSFNKELGGHQLNKSETMHRTDKINGSVDNEVHSPSPVLPQVSSSLPREFSLSRLLDAQSKSPLNASQRSFLLNTSSSVQKAVSSALTLAAKFDSTINKDRSYITPAVSMAINKEASSSQNQSTKAASILDLLYSAGSKTK